MDENRGWDHKRTACGWGLLQVPVWLITLLASAAEESHPHIFIQMEAFNHRHLLGKQYSWLRPIQEIPGVPRGQLTGPDIGQTCQRSVADLVLICADELIREV